MSIELRRASSISSLSDESRREVEMGKSKSPLGGSATIMTGLAPLPFLDLPTKERKISPQSSRRIWYKIIADRVEQPIPSILTTPNETTRPLTIPQPRTTDTPAVIRLRGREKST